MRSKKTSFEDKTFYKSIVEALQYATLTRPEISFSVNKLSQFMQEPKEMHWERFKRILRYLKETSRYGLYYTAGKEMKLEAFVDVLGC